jgi:hypothetical protein
VTNLLNPLLAGADFTATFFNDSIDNCRTIKYQAADGTRNNTTTYLDSIYLTAPLVASGVYVFDSCFFYDSSTAADIKIRLSLPAGTGALISPWGSTNTANTTTTNTINQQGAGPVSNIVEFTFSAAGSGTVMSARPSGLLAVAGTAGNLVVGHTQATATVVNTLLKLGSYFTLGRVL